MAGPTLSVSLTDQLEKRELDMEEKLTVPLTDNLSVSLAESESVGKKDSATTLEVSVRW